ncbi:Hypothetical_protein [Hexamita inflata]|uniref:Hypothetical_protein n=1 Tax=Hexamita inflata TaxID=28002 RepID=A0ABP1IT11_9EUKA
MKPCSIQPTGKSVEVRQKFITWVNKFNFECILSVNPMGNSECMKLMQQAFIEGDVQYQYYNNVDISDLSKTVITAPIILVENVKSNDEYDYIKMKTLLAWKQCCLIILTDSSDLYSNYISQLAPFQFLVEEQTVNIIDLNQESDSLCISDIKCSSTSQNYYTIVQDKSSLWSKVNQYQARFLVILRQREQMNLEDVLYELLMILRENRIQELDPYDQFIELQHLKLIETERQTCRINKVQYQLLLQYLAQPKLYIAFRQAKQ